MPDTEPPKHDLRCGRCGSADLQFFWMAMLVVRTSDGQVEDVGLSAMYDEGPDQYRCVGCGANEPIDPEDTQNRASVALGEAITAAVESQIPDSVRSAIEDGVSLYEVTPSARGRDLTVRLH